MGRTPSLNPKPKGPSPLRRAARFGAILGGAVLLFVLALALAVIASVE